MRQLILATCVGSAFWGPMASVADIKVLSAGAVEPGLQRAARRQFAGDYAPGLGRFEGRFRINKIRGF